MKGHRIRFLSVIATFMLISSILSSQALAVARSSKYLDAYGTYVSPVGNGKIVITIDVDALRSMTKIGATTIILYGSKDGKNFTVAKSYNYQDYPIMMSSGKHYYEDLFTYYGTVGYSYYVTGIEKNRNNAHFNFNPKYRYCPEFQNDYGEPISSNIAQILFDKNFSTLAVQLEGIDGDSRFLVLNASNREDALSQYAYLLDAKELKF